MAPSLVISNLNNNNNITNEQKDRLAYNPQLGLQDRDKFISDTLKTELEEKSRTYRSKKAFVTRKEESAAIRSRFPTKIPPWILRHTETDIVKDLCGVVKCAIVKIIVGRFHKEISLPKLDKCKFLVPQEITMSQFVTIIRNRMKLGSNQAFYLLINNRSMLSLSKTLAEVYSEHKEEDGFLYVTYASQEVFG